MNAPGLPFVHKDALISPCGLYRYWLLREWDASLAVLPFVMLNPSTADAEQDDPTIKRCMTFARRNGFGGIIVANLFAFRATKPADLWKAADPIGPDNDAMLLRVATSVAHSSASRAPIVCAWGSDGSDKGRDHRALIILRAAGAELRCLGTTSRGAPRHPLYVSGDQALEAFA